MEYNLFGEAIRPQNKQKSANYEEFVDKFKPKLTTDDCYTPPAVYDAVLQWARTKCSIGDDCNIVRPFYPGGDYESYEYSPNDVVVDNPPFSIITKIVKFYTAHNIRFFLFAPYLTTFQPGRHCTSIIVGVGIIYENGANVNTSFVTNMLGDIAIMSAPDLYNILEDVQKTPASDIPVYEYPANVIRATDVGKYSKRGIDFIVKRDECHFCTKLASQGSRSIFGGGVFGLRQGGGGTYGGRTYGGTAALHVGAVGRRAGNH